MFTQIVAKQRACLGGFPNVFSGILSYEHLFVYTRPPVNERMFVLSSPEVIA